MNVVLPQGIPILHIDLQDILLKMIPYKQQPDLCSVANMLPLLPHSGN